MYKETQNSNRRIFISNMVVSAADRYGTRVAISNSESLRDMDPNRFESLGLGV